MVNSFSSRTTNQKWEKDVFVYVRCKWPSILLLRTIVAHITTYHLHFIRLLTADAQIWYSNALIYMQQPPRNTIPESKVVLSAFPTCNGN